MITRIKTQLPNTILRTAAAPTQTPQTLQDRLDWVAAADDHVFPPMQAELIRADGTRLTKVAVRPSVDHRSLRVTDEDGTTGTVFLARDHDRNFIRRLNDDGTMVYSRKLSQGQSVKKLLYDGEQVYVLLHNPKTDDRDPEKVLEPSLFALDPKTGKVKKSRRLPRDFEMILHPSGGLWLFGSQAKHMRLNQNLELEWEQPTRMWSSDLVALDNGCLVANTGSQGNPLEILTSEGERLHRSGGLQSSDSPRVQGNKVWWLYGSNSNCQVEVYDAENRTHRALACAEHGRAVYPQPDQSYVTLHQKRYPEPGEKCDPWVEHRDPEGQLLSKWVLPAGSLSQVHGDPDSKRLVVVHSSDARSSSVYDFDLSRSHGTVIPQPTLSFEPTESRFYTPVVPTILNDGSLLVMRPDEVVHLDQRGRKDYKNLQAAEAALGDITPRSVWYRSRLSSPQLEKEQILEEASEKFPYPGLAAYPSTVFTHTDDCINIPVPGQAYVNEPATAKPLGLGLLQTIAGGHFVELDYSEGFKSQTVSFKRTDAFNSQRIELPSFRSATAVVAQPTEDSLRTLVGTDEGIVYYAEMPKDLKGPSPEPFKFDLRSPIASIEPYLDGSFIVRGEGGQTLRFNPDLYESFSYDQAYLARQESRADETDFEFEENGVQVGGIFLPFDS